MGLGLGPRLVGLGLGIHKCSLQFTIVIFLLYPSPPSATCEPYTGGFCAHLLGYKEQQPIYVDRHESEWDEHGQARAENWMLGLYHRTVSSKTELPNGCREGLQELICHSTIPLCSTPSKYWFREFAEPKFYCIGLLNIAYLLECCLLLQVLPHPLRIVPCPLHCAPATVS